MDIKLPGFIFGGVAGLIGGSITGLAMIPILLNLGNRRSTVNDRFEPLLIPTQSSN